LAFIEEAFDEFFVKYNRMPADLSAISDIETDENDSDGKNLMLELTGGEGDDLINVNRVNFLKMDDAANQNDPKNGFTRENGVVTGIYDPWGQAYKIQFDDDYDDKIMPEDFSDEVVSGVKFLISSRGKDGAFGTMDDVLSWD